MTEPDLVLELASGGKIRLYGGAATPQAVNVAESCETCRFFYQDTIDPRGLGKCRRRPPLASDRHIAQWPLVFSVNWCGEYEKQTN